MSQQKKLISSRRIFNFKAAISFIGLVVLFLLLSPPVLALETGVEYGTLTGLSTQDIRISIMKVVRILLGLVGLIALLIILYGGYIWMTSAGNSEKIEKAKKILINAAIGLAIILFAFGIVSFIIRMLQGGMGPTPPFGGTTPPGPCENCGHLGSGIIQNVYPELNQKNVGRNTLIMVTFKVDMKADSIIAGCTALPCSGDLAAYDGQPMVKIYRMDNGEDSRFDSDKVVASTQDGKTFTFDPVDYLDGSANNIWYSVKLMGGNNGIQKSGTQPKPAFPGAKGYFLWRFGVGDLLDLDPVEVKNVLPEPDNLADDYSLAPATAATGSIQLLVNPKYYIAASYDSAATTTAGTLGATVSGEYNGTYEGEVTVVLTNDTEAAEANVTWGSPDHPNSRTNADINGNTISLGSGLQLTLNGNHAGDGAVNAWTVTNLVPLQEADTLKIGNKTYHFVSSATPGPNEITWAANRSATANNISAKLNADSAEIGVTPTLAGNNISLTARTAGVQGNTIRLQATDAWANLCGAACNNNQINLAGGLNPDFAAVSQGAPDKARNTAFLVEFNEAINPLMVNANTMVIEYNNGTSWLPVVGTYLVSNQYKTVEVLSNESCLDAFGSPLVNSCGDKIYCWPVNPGTCSLAATNCNSDSDCPTDETCNYQPTNYRVTIKAGLLKTCANDGACTDNNFSFCRATAGGGSVCQGDGFESLATTPVAISVFYPEAAATPGGITDAANNSFNGNEDSYSFSSKIFGQADGPQSQSSSTPYILGDAVAEANPQNYGDDLVWSFYLNKSLDLTPPALIETGPNGLSPTVSLTLPIEATFGEVMLSSSLRPDNHYQDGYCECANADDCNDGQICENSRCKNQTGEQIYCTENKDCKDDAVCFNRKYVTLVDPTVLGIGYWVTADNLDVSPRDTYADQTRAVVRHSPFAEVTDYGAEIGSGVKDLYQNCYLPSKGPAKVCRSATGYSNVCDGDIDCTSGDVCVFVNHCNLTATIHCDDDLSCPATERCVSTCNPSTGEGCCGVSNTAPYCCEGVASSIPCQHCSNDSTRACGSDDDCLSGTCVF